MDIKAIVGHSKKWNKLSGDDGQDYHQLDWTKIMKECGGGVVEVAEEEKEEEGGLEEAEEAIR